MAILFVEGSGDEGRGTLNGLDRQGGLSWSVSGCCDVQTYLDLPPGTAGSIMMFGPKIRQPGATFHTRPSLIFNQISDPDTQTVPLERCARLCDQLGSPVINHPDAIRNTAREKTAKLLSGIPGVILPKTIRFNPLRPGDVFEAAAASGIGTPFIIRVAGEHGGKSMARVEDRNDLDTLHAFPLDGRDYYLIQFIDYQDDDGLYSKLRIAVIGEEMYVRHLIYDTDWKIHAENRDGKAYSHEFLMEKAGAMLDAVRPRVQRIREQLKLDYFGIDCNVGNSGEMLVFEANAAMNILPITNPDHKELVEHLRARVRAMIARRSGMKLD
jgi:glutathione synthase/RimK-type ligase-like ATP-grasp enzyme